MWIFIIGVSDMDTFHPVKYVFMIFYRAMDLGGWGPNAKTVFISNCVIDDRWPLIQFIPLCCPSIACPSHRIFGQSSF